MTTTPNTDRRPPAATARPEPCLEDIAAWVDEVAPILLTSPDRHWVAEQTATAVDALDVLENRSFDAACSGAACHEIDWVHARASGVLEQLVVLAAPAAA